MRRVVLLAMALTALAPGSAGAAGPPLEVPAAALARSLACSANLTSDHREPVLLVAGTTLTPDVNFDWNYEPALAQRGWPYCAVTLPDHEMGDIQVAAEYVVNALRTMHARTGRKVEYVGFSQGGMVGRWALRFWPDTRGMVDDYVGIDPSNHGTLDANALCLATCAPSIFQQTRGSRFLTALNTGAETFPGIDYTVVYSNTDEVVVPNFGPRASSALSGATNVAVQRICPLDISEHLAMGTYDSVGWALVVDAIGHPGAADPNRISRSVCLRLLMPGVNPATFALNEARLLALVGAQVATYPHVASEPPLKPYVS
jgi:triacylglycerol esterase/lipase EstA (alpha/beta hydrolase family)